MRVDQYGCLVREGVDFPGCVGDSMAETARSLILGFKTQDLHLHPFETSRGFVRHPEAPIQWREQDCSNDQLLPWLLASNLNGRKYIYRDWFIPGTNTLLNPGTFAAIRGWYNVLEKVNFAQSLIFGFPYRLSDDFSGIEKMATSSADYLNFACTHVALKKMGIATKLHRPKSEVMAKVQSYYANEPNSDWLIALYDENL